MSGPVVTVREGQLRGAEVQSVVGGSYLFFKGIPFAAPPVGDLRFKDPQPPKSWSGIRDALEEGPKCAQFEIFSQKFEGEDDCLYLNVATNSLTGSRPVMVWIHGGAFVVGNGGCEFYSPDYFMNSDIVFVSINYRLNIFGFLNVDHEAAPGNMGLKDQVAALTWVQENISKFGGDPYNVTIFGESAGSASVHYLLLSPLAKGLFHKAIAQSGVALNPWASVTNTVSIAHRFVAALGQNLTDPVEIVEYLRTVPAQRLVEVQEAMLTPEERINLVFAFGPSLDTKSSRPLLPRPIEELAKEGFDVPIIIGYNSHEGIMFLMGLQDEAYSKLDENFEIAVPRDLKMKTPSKVSEIAKEIRKFYFGDMRITNEAVDEYVQCCGDLHFATGIHKVVEYQSKKRTPTYFYRFSYEDPGSFTKSLFQVSAKGVMHSEELQYLFFTMRFRDYVKLEPGSPGKIVSDRLIRMWTNFAKTGNPTPVIDDVITRKWEPITTTKENYLEIGADLLTGVNLNDAMWQNWKRIYAMFGHQ